MTNADNFIKLEDLKVYEADSQVVGERGRLYYIDGKIYLCIKDGLTFYNNSYHYREMKGTVYL